MKPKSKSLTSNECKIIAKSSSSSMLKKSNPPKQPQLIKATQKKPKNNGKQNMETSNIPSPEERMKNKTFKPRIRRGSKLEMQSTVSLVINQSTTQLKKQDLLDSLLYGEVDLTYSQDFNHKDEESQELLIASCDQGLNFKHCKNLSPIKSISEYSVTENENQIFVVQKTQNPTANAILKFRNRPMVNNFHKKFEDCVLLRRLLLHFHEKHEALPKFYTTIHQSIAKQDLFFKIREYMFQNGIIFKKTELNELIQELCAVLVQENKDPKRYQFCEENLQIMMQKVFLSIPQQTFKPICDLWIVEDIHEKLFDQKDLVSGWKLVLELCSQVPKEIEASFRQSRFCVSMDSSVFIHEPDEKRKKDNMSTVLKWFSQFIRPISQKVNKKQEEQKFTIKITPPPASAH